MRCISPTNVRATIHNQGFIGIRWFNNQLRMQYLLCIILFFAISSVNLTTWVSSTRDVDCEQSQVPCLVPFNNYDQVDNSLSKESIPECFKICHSSIKISFPVPTFEDLPLSDSNTCKCTRGSRGQTPTFRGKLTDLPQRPIYFTLATSFQGGLTEPVISWSKNKSFRPPDHLKPHSTIVLII